MEGRSVGRRLSWLEPMGDLAGTAVRVTPERHQADEWAVVLAAGNIPHRLRPGLDGWALIVAARDAEAAREALDAYDRESIADTADVGADAVAPIRGAAVVGVAVGLLLIGFFAVTGTRASRSTWFERGSADAGRIVAGEWWRTVTALTLHADAPHVIGNAVASVLLVGAVSQQLGPGVGLCALLPGGARGVAAAPTLPRLLRPPVQWALAVAVLAVVVGAWRAVS